MMRRGPLGRAALTWLLLLVLIAPPAAATPLDLIVTRSADPAQPGSSGSRQETPPDHSAGGGKPCEHPHPCGYQWQGPPGPYEVAPAERVQIPTHDGVVLNGWLWRPVIAGDVPVPVILISTPYTPQGSTPSSPGRVGGVPGEDFVRAGYAVALVSVRGTGDSGGCFGFKSAAEQRDQATIVEWLGSRSWSNGRVGMIGLSYPGTTPVMAATQNPQSLKTIVIAGTILDEYGFLHTPQGAQFFEAFGVGPAFTAQESFGIGDPPGSLSPQRIATTTERVCPEVIEVNTVIPEGEVRGERNPGYWIERRFIDGVPDISAATFVVHGFQDRYGSGHAFQDDWAWQTLISAPKRMLIGQWWHEWPNRNSINPEWSLKDWPQRLLGWFDYWLKGWGESAPGLGSVEFQDSTGDWHRSDAWPPPALKNEGRGHIDDHGPDAGLERRSDEVLYLRDGAIKADPGEEKSSFLSIPPQWRGGTTPFFFEDRNGWRWTSPCQDPTRLVYMSEPVNERTVLAGNPWAWLNVSSSGPGGVFEVQLYDVGPDFRCDQFQMQGVRPLTEGSVDLQYHASEDYRARRFPIGSPTHVRVDLPNLSEVLKPGHRLAVVISRGVYYRWASTHDFLPLITLLGNGEPGSSHLVLPVIEGGFGGSEPTIDYPPRPFMPECCR